MDSHFLTFLGPVEGTPLLHQLSQANVAIDNEKEDVLKPILLLLAEWKSHTIYVCNEALI